VNQKARLLKRGMFYIKATKYRTALSEVGDLV